MSVCGRERSLRLCEVLTRNRQSAVGLLGRILGKQEQPPRMFTIPPRQQLSSPTRLAIRGRNFTHLIINTHTHTRKRDTRRERNTPFTLVKKRDTLTLISVSETSPEKQSSRPYSYHTQHRDAFESEKAKKSKSRERSVSVFQEASI